MNISNALNNAASGLSATARLADTISSNVANAMTPGFARRTTELTSLALGGYGTGVRAMGTQRSESPYLTAERRILDASLGATSTRSDTYGRMMSAIGEPGNASALSTRATRLETTLMAAVASPQSTAKLSDAVGAAKSLVASVNAIARENVNLRTEADAQIARQVQFVNDALHAINDINGKISTLKLQGADYSGLQDERGRLVDAIAPIIPVRTARRDDDRIAIYAQNGGMLLDGQVWELKFNAAPNAVTPDMTIANGGLSGLSQDQNAPGGPVALRTGTPGGPLDGGSLGALFQVRDEIVPEFDAEIDRYAGDLIQRFRDDLMPAAALDGAGDGLLVGANPADPGLAGRLAVNATADPAQGGEVWRLRDGLGSAAPGPEGFGGYLQALSDAMSEPRNPTGFVSQTAQTGSATMASEIASFFAGRMARSDDDRAYLTAQQSVMVEQETSATGVNTDTELQTLMLVEQTYAANARVLSVIDDLMKLLMGI